MRNPEPEPATLHISDDTLLFLFEPPKHSRPIDFFNDQLHEHRLGRPFGEPVHLTGAIHTVPVHGDDTASVVMQNLRSLNLAEQFAFEPAHVDGTFVATSKPVGHGGLGFVEIAKPADIDPLPFPRPPAGLRRPVVALLDTGVRRHAWLPEDTDPDDKFLLRAEAIEPEWIPGRLEGGFKAHPEVKPEVPVYGHATFIAGLIRQGAPTAQVLDIPVMNGNGKANESKVCDALVWLLDYIGSGHPVDVVLMAFGRLPGDETDKELLEKLHGLLIQLADKGVQLIASAGNDQQAGEIYPAAFPEVTGVGAGFGHYRAAFSNFGGWVDRYRDGVDVLSIMPERILAPGQAPGDRWARWSGTSFAAANFAADIARPHVP